MKKFVLDTHIHTLASGHAYSTLMEYIVIAKEKGIQLIAQTDHGPAMPGGPHEYHIGNQVIIPRVIEGVEVLRGVEANIINCRGEIDIPIHYLKRLDIIIASLHEPVIAPGTIEENTNTLIEAMKNPMVDVIAHAGNPKFPIDIPRFVAAAIENSVLVEINNSSFSGTTRVGSDENCIEIARVANTLGAQVIAGTDSHIAFQLGEFQNVQAVFEAVDMDEELIINNDIEKLKKFLRNKGRNIA